MKKLGNSFKGIFGGFIFIVIGVILLWWNEGNNVANLKTTKEMAEIVVDVTSEKVDAANEGKLIATYGELINEEELMDTKFDVKVKTPLLRRIVEVYQWEEYTESDENDDTVYRYKKVWSESLNDSSQFHEPNGHTNPSMKPYDSEVYTSSLVKVGAFKLTDSQVNSLSTEGSVTDFNQELVTELGYKVVGKYITNTKEDTNPQIGDVRITFVYNNSNEVSVLAVQAGDSFTDFVSKAGKSINRVMDGRHSGIDMINVIKKENNILKWILRAAGALCCILGFATILKPISTMASFVPILGGLVGSAVGLVAFVLGLAVSLVVIAIAWIRFRPILGIILLVIVAALIVFLVMRSKKTNVTATTVPGQPQMPEQPEQPQNNDINQTM